MTKTLISLFFLFTCFNLSPENKSSSHYYITEKVPVRGFAYESNEDIMEVVYPGDKVSVLYIEEDLTRDKVQNNGWARITLKNGVEGFVPEKFLSRKKPKRSKRKIIRERFVPTPYTVIVNRLNIRSEPSQNADVLGQLNKGNTVSLIKFSDNSEWIDGVSAKWAYIKYNDQVGWVFSGYLSLSNTPTTIDIIEPSNVFEIDKKFKTSHEDTPIYDMPNNFIDPVGSIPPGSEITILKINPRFETLEGKLSKWLYVNSSKGKGWIFGGDLVEVAETIKKDKKKFSHPLKPKSKYKITSKYGPRKLKGAKPKFHAGMDFYHFDRIGAPIYSVGDGQVILAQKYYSYGNLVVIKHGNGMVTYYAHLNKILVKKNSKVEVGEKIGELGTTGYSTGPHLHFEVREDLGKKHFNPALYLQN
ncbi:MAG: peptidoglycan DD-metalloendopeptidase family protein [Leptospiraceae bacterium]|nr:peptidoglycan DD-metalloendopeptidase family protein [Leptospiraceae bacterium]MCP5513658.1 peptidoglycan DD-metalloendopeptidase family protein [Leptospiraceae bacterium]